MDPSLDIQSVEPGHPAPVADPMALVCLGWMAWGRSWKRNQSMVYQLSRQALFDRAVFVNPKALWLIDQFRPDEGRLADRWRRVCESLPRSYDERIRICSQWHFIPFKRQIPLGLRLEEWMLRRTVRGFVGKRRFVLLNNHPNFYSRGVLDELMETAALRVFDLSDDFVEFFTVEEHREHFRRNIEYCCSRSDLVFTVNQHVADKYGHHNPNTVVIPNSTNFSNFHRPVYSKIPWLDRIRQSSEPVLGCTGIINRIRIDYELLEAVVARRPRWQFVFIGSADASFVELANRHDNVHYHGQVPYEELPDFINYFDAAIIPFRVNEHTRGNDLLKFHDYLAMGKSIVTTNTGGAWKYPGLLHVAEDVDSFIRAAEAALEPVSEEMRARRIDVARQNSWSARAKEIERIIRDRLQEVGR